jgi:hypothetical protein
MYFRLKATGNGMADPSDRSEDPHIEWGANPEKCKVKPRKT